MLITGIVDVKAPMANKVAHLTMYTDQMKPMHSNAVLEGLFCEFEKGGKSFKFNDLHDRVMDAVEPAFVKVLKSSFKKKSFPLYLARLETPLLLHGVGQTYY